MQGRESDTGVRNYIQIDFLAYHRQEVIPDTVIQFHLYVVIITGDTPVIECPLVQSMKFLSQLADSIAPGLQKVEQGRFYFLAQWQELRHPSEPGEIQVYVNRKPGKVETDKIDGSPAFQGKTVPEQGDSGHILEYLVKPYHLFQSITLKTVFPGCLDDI